MARPITIETSIFIDAPPARVWPHLVDWEHLGDWMKEGKSFRLTSHQREGVGVTAEATIKVGGIVTNDAIEVTQWAPPELLEIEHKGWVSGIGFMQCLAKDAGTRMYWRETLAPPLGILGAIGIRAFKPVLTRIFVRDLGLLKQLVEGKARNAPSG